MHPNSRIIVVKTNQKGDSMAQNQFKVGDKVIRIHTPGCQGVVKDVREETVQQGDSRERERPVIIGVQWDNGTVSFFGPSGLQVVK